MKIRGATGVGGDLLQGVGEVPALGGFAEKIRVVGRDGRRGLLPCGGHVVTCVDARCDRGAGVAEGTVFEFACDQAQRRRQGLFLAQVCRETPMQMGEVFALA